MNNILVERLKHRMRAAEINATALEKKANLNFYAVRNILNGRSKNPTVETIRAIAAALRCTVDELIGTDDIIPHGEAINSSFGPPLNFDLFEDTVSFIKEYLKARKTTMHLDQAIFFIKEIYTYSSGTPDKKLEKNFGEWIINQKFRPSS